MAVASVKTIPAPPSANCPRWTRRQSGAPPSSPEEYWHLGARAVPLRAVRPRSLIGFNSNGSVTGGFPQKAVSAGDDCRVDECRDCRDVIFDLRASPLVLAALDIPVLQQGLDECRRQIGVFETKAF